MSAPLGEMKEKELGLVRRELVALLSIGLPVKVTQEVDLTAPPASRPELYELGLEEVRVGFRRAPCAEGAVMEITIAGKRQEDHSKTTVSITKELVYEELSSEVSDALKCGEQLWYEAYN